MACYIDPVEPFLRQDAGGGVALLPRGRRSRIAERNALFGSLRRTTTDIALPVRGMLPDWLAGTLVRNGPSLFDPRAQLARHWYDGLAMLHRFEVRGRTVRYANRFLVTDTYRTLETEGRTAVRGFATVDPCSTLFGRIRTLFVPFPADNANISVARFGGEAVALSESALPIVFDRDTLETLGVYQVNGEKTLGNVLTTAHPLPGRDGNVLGQMTRFGRYNHYEVYELDPVTKRSSCRASLQVREPGYMHSFAASDRHVVLTESPLTYDPLRMVLTGQSFIDSLRWRPANPTRFLVFDRNDGPMKIIEGDPFFVFHHVNAHDDGDDIVVDLIGFDDPSIIHAFHFDHLRTDEKMSFARPQLRRYRLQPALGRAVLERRSDAAIELPQIDDRRFGVPHRYTYGCSLVDANSVFFDSLIRVDGERNQSLVWSEPACYPSEPIFVPRPGGDAEHDGVVLSVVLDAHSNQSFLLALDAASMTEIARAETPFPIPAGLHGAFMPS
jgi:carotenoid cleavage dioxygenase-like enzyme